MKDAVSVTFVSFATPTVLIMNEVDAFPAGTVSADGTGAEALVDESFTEIPPVGATPDRVITAPTTAPPGVVVGLTVKPVKAGGFTVIEAVLVTDPFFAVIVTILDAVTPVVFIVKSTAD